MAQPLQQRGVPESDRFKARQVQLRDMRTRDAEDLAQHAVADVLRLTGLIDQLAKLELDQVVDLRFGELLHVEKQLQSTADFANVGDYGDPTARCAGPKSSPRSS